MSPVLHRPVYTLHVELLEIEPVIWRRVEVPAAYTLAQLHAVIQHVMPWDDSHMHLFEIGATRYGFGDNEYDPDEQDAADVVLGDVGLIEGDRFTYTYDFGDSWVHRLTLERVRRDVPDAEAPRLIGGERASPPEDCGGVSGYYDLLEALADADHEEHDPMKQWLGRPWHPDDFDVARHDRQLRRWARPQRAPRGGGGAGAGRRGRATALSGSAQRIPASAGNGRGRTPPHMARVGEVLAMIDALRRGLPGLPDSVIDLTVDLIQHYCLAEPDEFMAVRKPELWLAAGVHAAFMLHPRFLRYAHKPLTLAELADICGVSVASISKRSRQLREGVRVQWGQPGGR